MPKKVVTQNHHVIYPGDKNKELTSTIRRGVHEVVYKIRRFTHLEPVEVWTIIVEALLKIKMKGVHRDGKKSIKGVL